MELLCKMGASFVDLPTVMNYLKTDVNASTCNYALEKHRKMFNEPLLNK